MEEKAKEDNKINIQQAVFPLNHIDEVDAMPKTNKFRKEESFTTNM